MLKRKKKITKPENEKRTEVAQPNRNTTGEIVVPVVGSEETHTEVVYKNYTSWVTIVLLLFGTCAAVTGLWFYMNFMFEMPEMQLASLSSLETTDLVTEYEPKDIRATPFEKHDKEFNKADMKTQSYIYSRDHVLYMSLMSGTGDSMALFEEQIAELAKSVDLLGTYDVSDGFRTIKNVFLASGSIFQSKPDFTKLTSMGLKKTNQEYAPSDEALGWLILQETEWGEHFQYEKVFGAPGEKDYAVYRVLGAIMVQSAKMQALKWIEVDHDMTPSSEYVLATAFLNLSKILESDKLVGVSNENPFQDVEAAATIEKAAKRLFMNAKVPQDMRTMAIASSMMGLYGHLDPSSREEIKKRLELMHQRLIVSDPITIADRSWAVVTYIEIGKRLNDPSITDEGWEIYDKRIKSLYMPDTGMFYDQDIYSVSDVTAVLHMLNRINEVGGQYWNQGEIDKFKLEFFESLVNQSRLQRSHLPEASFPIPEKLFDAEWSFYPTVEESPIAGGEYGKPPIVGHRTWFNGERWMLYDDKYVSEEGLYFSYVLMTMSSDYFSDVKNWSTNGISH